MTAQAFGAAHTREKLRIVEAYLPAFTNALKYQPFRLHYVDAFAGTGKCKVKVDGEQVEIPGSAMRAIECTPPFNHLLFIEKSSRKLRALERIKASRPDLDINLRHGDANTKLCEYIATMGSQDRGIVFLDPFGMQVEWGTLQYIARRGITDVWYLFSLSGLYRQAALSFDQVTPAKRAAVTRALGSEDWIQEFYESDPQGGLFGPSADVRAADLPKMLGYVKTRLGSIFPGVAGPRLLSDHAARRPRCAALRALLPHGQSVARSTEPRASPGERRTQGVAGY
jgi:three-Cys-motif partner protein